jgi:hypothetical protein
VDERALHAARPDYVVPGKEPVVFGLILERFAQVYAETQKAVERFHVGRLNNGSVPQPKFSEAKRVQRFEVDKVVYGKLRVRLQRPFNSVGDAFTREGYERDFVRPVRFEKSGHLVHKRGRFAGTGCGKVHRNVVGGERNVFGPKFCVHVSLKTSDK